MWKRILSTAFIAGTLDIIAACLHAYLQNHVPPEAVLRYISSAVFGTEAVSGSMMYVILGLVFHYTIAFACTTVFFFLYQSIRFLRINVLLNAILIGIVAWATTTRGIIPFTKIKQGPFDIAKALTAISILVVCIGLPVAISARQYFTKSNATQP